MNLLNKCLILLFISPVLVQQMIPVSHIKKGCRYITSAIFLHAIPSIAQHSFSQSVTGSKMPSIETLSAHHSAILRELCTIEFIRPRYTLWYDMFLMSANATGYEKVAHICSKYNEGLKIVQTQLVLDPYKATAPIVMYCCCKALIHFYRASRAKTSETTH